MRKLTFLILIGVFLCWTACDHSDGLGGNDPINPENDNETETVTQPNEEVNDQNENENENSNPNDSEEDGSGENEAADLNEEEGNEDPNDNDPIDDEENNDTEENTKRDFQGNGIVENPYLIITATDLRDLAERVNTDTTFNYAYAHYRLTADIDLQGIEFTPIGTSGNRFTGTFDGNGKTVTGLHITVERADNGLFGLIGTGGKVFNLGVTGTVTNGENSGGIAGASFGTVENCYSTVTVSGKNNAGGIVGYNRSNAKIDYCYSTGSVTSTGSSGGITGYSTSSAYVRQCVSFVQTVNGIDGTGRISGNALSTLTNNKALETILVNGKTIEAEVESKAHGTGFSYGTELSVIFDKWEKSIWNIPQGILTPNGELPTLK